MASADYFLKIDGIPGESQDDKHKGEIELDSFSWGASNVATSASGGGGGAGKVKFDDFVIWKPIDVSSPKLIEACTTGKHISSAVLYVRKQGGTQQEYVKVTLTDVLVSNYDLGSGALVGRRQHSALSASSRSNTQHNVALDDPASPVPMEEISLNFSKIEYEYREQDNKGGLKGPVKTVWDVKANKAS
jgi:type VI secretion system secreted protein Hcp